MRRAIDLAGLWTDARRLALADLADDGHAAPSLPADCPFILDDLLAEASEPRPLAARLDPRG